LGFEGVLTLDLLDDPVGQDLAHVGVQEGIIALRAAGAFVCLGGGPPCSSMSVAIAPPVRTKQYPAGAPWMRDSMKSRVGLANVLSRFTSSCIIACQGDLFFWIENPRSSWLWKQKCWKRLLDQPGVDCWDVDYCLCIPAEH
jgi:hypothetical protein